LVVLPRMYNGHLLLCSAQLATQEIADTKKVETELCKRDTSYMLSFFKRYLVLTFND